MHRILATTEVAGLALPSARRRFSALQGHREGYWPPDAIAQQGVATLFSATRVPLRLPSLCLFRPAAPRVLTPILPAMWVGRERASPFKPSTVFKRNRKL
jgi:hypothetical protein